MRYFTIIILLMLFFAGVYGYDPTVFVSGEAGLIVDGEQIKNFKELKHGEQNFYVVPVYSGEETIGFISLEKEQENLVNKKVTNNALFKTSDFIIEYSETKKQINDDPALVWFVSESLRAKNIANFLESEKNHLTLIDNELSDAAVASLVITMKNQLTDLSLKAIELSSKMETATEMETNFLNLPETGQETDLKNALDDVFDTLKELDEMSLVYNANVDTLKGLISTADVELDTKRSLLDLADPPADYSIIGTWATNVDKLQLLIENTFNMVISRASNWADLFENRLDRQKAFIELFEPDSKLKTEAGQSYAVLENAAGIMLSEENAPLWKNQADLKLLESNWEKAQNFYSKGDYQESINFAKRAKNNVISIKKEGFVDGSPGPEPNYNLLFNGIIAILAIGAIVFIIKNKDKILGSKEEEKVEF